MGAVITVIGLIGVFFVAVDHTALRFVMGDGINTEQKHGKWKKNKQTKKQEADTMEIFDLRVTSSIHNRPR